MSRKLTTALSAAEAGIDVVQSKIRAVESSNKLPCGPFTGEVSGAAGSRYDVMVAYYKEDPSGKPEGWLEKLQPQARLPAG